MPSVSKESLRGSQLPGEPCGWWTLSPTSCACSKTPPSRTKRVPSIRCVTWKTSRWSLMLSDLLVVEKRLERLEKDRKKIKNPELDREFELLEKCKATLEANHPLRQLELDAEAKNVCAASSSYLRSPYSTC